MSLPEKSEALRRKVLRPWAFKVYLVAKIPLAFCAGLRLVQLDEESCRVRLPGGWRTQNPFRSTYFAAQMMAAELSTGAPAMMLAGGMSVSTALILREVRAVFTKRIQGPSLFLFSDVRGMRAVVEKAAASTESEAYTGRVTGTEADGGAASEFEITWSFKARG